MSPAWAAWADPPYPVTARGVRFGQVKLKPSDAPGPMAVASDSRYLTLTPFAAAAAPASCAALARRSCCGCSLRATGPDSPSRPKLDVATRTSSDPASRTAAAMLRLHCMLAPPRMGHPSGPRCVESLSLRCSVQRGDDAFAHLGQLGGGAPVQ